MMFKISSPKFTICHKGLRNISSGLSISKNVFSVVATSGTCLCKLMDAMQPSPGLQITSFRFVWLGSYIGAYIYMPWVVRWG